ncbi:GTP-binding protein [Salipaludibacillus sp. LMS25]|uniref:GTP-binding protein n=1 Tax=Salipaludibacillus sp. LMS25 TaxID=2924031 RepID=UPI0020D0514F|nr:GTP-binding protein [Salipaludibacillus sp. LMS25]
MKTSSKKETVKITYLVENHIVIKQATRAININEHPVRLRQWREEWPEEVVRAKGFLWIATQNSTAALVSQTGSIVTLQWGRQMDSCSQ